MASLSRQEQDAVKERFVADLPAALDRFRGRARRAGLSTEGVTGLREVGEWFLDEVVSPESVEGYRLPVWWNPDARPRGEAGPGHEMELTRDQVALVDDAQAYYADALNRAFPAARWVVFRSRSRYDVRNGWPLLQLDRPQVPAETVRALFIPAMRVATGGRIEADFLLQRFNYDLPSAAAGVVR